MTEHRAFLKAICADPGNDLPRLVFADWLEESHDPIDNAWGRFIRLQIEMQQYEEYEPEWMERDCEAERLHRMHGKTWSQRQTRDFYVAYTPGYYEINRGFVAQQLIDSDCFCKQPDNIMNECPNRSVSMMVDDGGVSLAQSPALALLEGLKLYQTITRLALEQLLASPYLNRLKTLSFEPVYARFLDDFNTHNTSGQDVAGLFAKCKSLTALETLIPPRNQVTAEGMRLLGHSKYLKNLHTLNLDEQEHGVFHALANTPMVHQLKELTMSLENDDAAESFTAIMQAKPRSLERLYVTLDDSYNTDHVCDTILANSNHCNLTELDINGPVGNGGIEQLLMNGSWPKLRRLQLRLFKSTDSIAEALSNATLPALRELTSTGWSWSIDAVKKFAQSPILSGLTALDIHSTKLWTYGAMALATSPYLGELRELSINDTAISNKGFTTIARSANLPKLRRLDIGNNHKLTKEGMAALVEPDSIGPLDRVNSPDTTTHYTLKRKLERRHPGACVF